VSLAFPFFPTIRPLSFSSKDKNADLIFSTLSFPFPAHNRSTPNTPLLVSPLATRPNTPNHKSIGLLTPMTSSASVSSLFALGSSPLSERSNSMTSVSEETTNDK
jgi:hypothetical protein